MCQRGPLRFVTRPASSTYQAVSIQDGMYSADGRHGQISMATSELLTDLRRTPTGIFLFELDDALLDLEREAIGIPRGPSGAIVQPLQAAVFIARENLVAGFSGDIELATQGRHLLPIQQSGHETHSLIHLATLPPWHLRVSRKGRKVLPMCSERSVTYVPESTKSDIRYHPSLHSLLLASLESSGPTIIANERMTGRR